MGGSTVGYGSAAIGQGNVPANDATLKRVLELQSDTYSLFPRSHAALITTNATSGLLQADAYATHGVSKACQFGIAHVHITSKGRDLDVGAHGFQCTPHCDQDGVLDVGKEAQQSIGAWWPLGGVQKNAGFFGYNGAMMSLHRPIAALFNTAYSHRSVSSVLPPGQDIIGTSTEVSIRDYRHCVKRSRE